jgi:protein gp37
VGNTSIEWTDVTWNPTRGCTRVSPGCEHCYAEKFAGRFSGPGQPYEGLVKLVARDARTEPRWTGEVRVVPEQLAKPLRWRKPRRVFVNSMSDLFHEALSNEEIAAVFGVMAASPHTFQILTKRSERLPEWFRWMEDRVEDEACEWAGRDCSISLHDARHGCMMEYLDETACSALAGHFDCCHLGLTTSKAIRWPLPNVWIGVSVENQAAADERIPALLATPAAVRFLSCEPLLERVDLSSWLACHCYGPFSRSHNPRRGCPAHDVGPHLGWIVAGCESGPGARPAQVDWYRSLRDQCATASVPFFLKQAKHTPGDFISADALGRKCSATLAIGADVGSKRKPGGVISRPTLDGVQHVAFPEAA